MWKNVKNQRILKCRQGQGTADRDAAAAGGTFRRKVASFCRFWKFWKRRKAFPTESEKNWGRMLEMVEKEYKEEAVIMREEMAREKRKK